MFREREGREKESKRNTRERNIDQLPLAHAPTWGRDRATTQACALTGNRTSDPLVHRPVLNTLSYTSYGSQLNTFLSKE